MEGRPYGSQNPLQCMWCPIQVWPSLSWVSASCKPYFRAIVALQFSQESPRDENQEHRGETRPHPNMWPSPGMYVISKNSLLWTHEIEEARDALRSLYHYFLPVVVAFGRQPCILESFVVVSPFILLHISWFIVFFCTKKGAML